MEDRMNLAATWENEEPERAMPLEGPSDASSSNNIATLRDLVLRLLCEVQNINEVSAITIGSDFDFYDEVSRFEIDLIRRALLQTGGHQMRAAKLLNLKVTTLNSKIKHYKINLTPFANVYPLVGPNESGQQQQHA
ncbi:MAG TPA: helix-turn-helix domain-containing protein [Pyrinomonadaceae bacterium]|nr:helix-turn-helix domain-containing protein [Pyrinomonadaceae bacterium]